MYVMWLCFFELVQYPTEVKGRWVKPTGLLMGVPTCTSMTLFLKQTTVLSRLQPFSHLLLYFSVWKHCVCFAFLKSSLAMQEMSLCRCSIQPQHLRRQMASSGDCWCSALHWEVFWISPISCGLSSCSLLRPQCVLHLPQLCRDNLHSPSSLAATPSCPWAKKSPYCSKEHMQQSLMLTLIVPIQTTQ